jgi:hypothetical protein
MSLLEDYNILLYIQNNFDKNISERIFNNLSDHLYKKWISCDQNILHFISVLDSENKNKILFWGKNTYKKINLNQSYN